MCLQILLTQINSLTELSNAQLFYAKKVAVHTEYCSPRCLIVVDTNERLRSQDESYYIYESYLHHNEDLPEGALRHFNWTRFCGMMQSKIEPDRLSSSPQS